MLNSLDASWKHWIKENLGNGVPKIEIAKILVQNHFKPEEIKFELDLDELFPSNPVKISPEKLDNTPGFQRLHQSFPIYSVDSFVDPDLSHVACELIRKTANPSTIGSDRDTAYDSTRTSQTAYFLNQGVNFGPIHIIEEKIHELLGMELRFAEPIQGQWYKPGQEFKRHFDSFTPDKETVLYYGNRPWTAMIYLNNVEKGGHTSFPEINVSVKPKQGTLLVWQNTQNSVIIPESSHVGEPVEEGEKFILTKWFREKEWPFILPR